MTTVDRDAYFVIYTTMPSGFECKIPARGYNLKSWLAFEDRLNATYYYEQTTREVYEHLVFGDPNAILDTEDDNGRTDKRKAQQKTPAKRKPRQATNKDSKTDGVGRKATTSVRKAQPSKLREPKVRNVRKPKEDVQGTNNPRTKSASGNGTRKSKTR